MDESAHTFGATNASVSSHFKRGGSPVMITDALSDVRANYHIEAKELGHGHYGVVRKCMHRESGAWYAIKSIRKSKVSKIEVLKREIEILKEVKHPHIIELTEVYEDERYLHLITEICSGGELFDRIIEKTQSAEGHFSEHDAAALVRDILDAIRYCHDEKGYV
jgi:calcium-dependent protein kinase